jgi:hydroxymethylbilane synthase
MTMLDAATGSIRIGTRGSALALIQAGIVGDALRDSGATVSLETIVTDGDRRVPDTAWGEGAFVAAIERALLDGRIDVAVHSAKDVPTDGDDRLTIAAYLPREAPDDVLVLPGGRQIESLDGLAHGARVGTDSPRRTAFLLAARPDLRVHPLHGNVDTRLRRLDAGETDALVLAAAGLRRLRRAERISFVLPSAVVPPAPGQGALAVQVRAADEGTRALVGRLDDAGTRRAVEAERALLTAAGGGCRAPIGAIGTVGDDRLVLRAGFATPDGRVAVAAAQEGPRGRDRAVIASVLGSLTERAIEAAARSGCPSVVLTRPAHGAIPTLLAMVGRGLTPVHVPTISMEDVDPQTVDAAVARAASVDWVVVTSATAVRVLSEAAVRSGADLAGGGARWAAVGGMTARALRAAGVPVAFQAARSTAAALADTLPVTAGETVLLPRGDQADGTLLARLTQRGAHVEASVVYRTVEAPSDSRGALAAALAAGPRAAIVMSGSAVRGWVRLGAEIGREAATRSVPLVAIGPTTAAEVRRHGLRLIAESTTPDPATLAETTATAVRSLQEDP